MRRVYKQHLPLLRGIYLSQPAARVTRPVSAAQPVYVLRLIVAVAALLLALVTGSGARLAEPHLMAVKCGACRKRMAHLTNRRSVGLCTTKGSIGGRPQEARWARRLAPTRFTNYPPPAWHALTWRPSGDTALGVSVPKSRRWLVVGGHGRHGAG